MPRQKVTISLSSLLSLGKNPTLRDLLAWASENGFAIHLERQNTTTTTPAPVKRGRKPKKQPK